MDVVLVSADPDRLQAFEEAVLGSGHRSLRIPRAFARAMDALNAADAVVCDFADEQGTAAWCLAYALARGRLAVAVVPAHVPLPWPVKDNPSPYQRVVVGDARLAARALAELLTV